jgi:DNA-binding FrmR family transcriptional regulator
MATKKARKVAGEGYAEDRDDLLRRLRRIEGQIRGIQQMIEGDRNCVDVVQQINAVVAASREVSARILGAHLHHCLTEAVSRRDGKEAVGEMVGVVRQMLKA